MKKRLMSIVMAVVLLMGIVPVVQPVEAAATNYTEKWNECVAKWKADSDNKNGWTNTGAGVPVWGGQTANTTSGSSSSNAMTIPRKDSYGRYQVYFPEQLAWAMLQTTVNGMNTGAISIVIMCDMNLGGSSSKNWPSVQVRLGNGLTIEGNGKTLYNLYVNRTSSDGGNGFIDRAYDNIYLYNLKFVSAGISSTGAETGLIGRVGNNKVGYLRNVSLEKALVRGTIRTGGLVGQAHQPAGTNTGLDPLANWGTIEANQCTTKEVYVKGESHQGNMFGKVCGKIDNCYAVDGVVVSSDGTAGHSGGLMACTEDMVCKNSFTNVTLYGNTYCGGFVGAVFPYVIKTNGQLSSVTFENCFSSGIVEGTNMLGGFVGIYDKGITTRPDMNINGLASFKYCYSTTMVGMLGGGVMLGGFAGYMVDETKVSLFECYAAGEVGDLDTVPGKSIQVAGFLGTQQGKCNYCAYDMQTTAMKGYAAGKSDLGATTKTGVRGATTKNMTGSSLGVNGYFDNSKWVFTDGQYPQINNLAGGFTSEQRPIVQAYSAASVATAFLRDETSAGGSYDTVREIVDPFQFTNNSNTNSWWGTKYTWDAEPKVISPVVKDTPVITIDKKGSADEVSNMAAGIGWAKVSATYDGKATGNRSMRFVPTTVLSLGGQTGMDIGKDKIIYPTIPNAAQKEKRYDHVDGVTFVKATASELNNSPGSIRPSGFPAGDKYTNVGVTCGVTTGKVTVTLEKTDSSGKKTTIALNGTDAESLRYQRLFNGLEDFTAADLGVYKLTYSWQVSNSDVKTILTNSKTLTVRTPLQLTYDMNLPKDETAPADVVVDNLKVNQQITSLQAPTRTGYTFVEWNTKEDGTGSKITAPYTMQDNVTFYAKWQANKYTVTFDYDDVTTGLTDVVVKDIEYKGTVGDKYPSAPAMEENVGGKIFYGWSANPLAENVVYFDANTEVTDNITLHPVWHNGEHTVTFIDKDGTTVGTPQIIKHGENAKAETPPDVVGYAFNGWYDAAENGQKVESFENIKADLTVYAQYTKIPVYDITFTDDEGNIIGDPVVVEEGKTLDKDGFPKDPEKEGHDFDGWVDEDGNYFDENTVVEGEKKIKPSWKPKEYTVTYVSGDFGSIGGETTPETVVYGQKPTHKITTKPMIKCDFVGFEYVDKNGHTKSTLDTQKVVIECDTTFKAVFIKWPFLMASSNHAKVGIGFGDALPNITDNTVVEHVPPEDDGTGGSCIAYWKPDAGHRLSSIEVSLAKIEGSKMALDLGTTNPQSFLVGDKTVTMVVDLENERVLFDKLDESVYVNFMFEAEQKTVTFVDKDGNTVGTPQKVDYGSDARVEKAPEYEGLIFTGWYSAQEGGDKVENFKKITEDLTVYAQYKVREHTVTFKDKDSQTIGVPQVIVHDGNAVEEAAPVIEGFAFKGWYTAPDGGKKVISFTNIKEDVTVYAQYEKLPDEVSYTVTGTKYGYGSITEGTGKFKDGASTTVKWKADPGYKVTQVIIDGKVRDDLLKAGQFEFKDIHENHEVYVAFSKAEENEKPNEEYYTVYTTKKGDEEGCDLTETSTVKAGENHTVVWRVKEGYQIKHITVDGVAYAISDVGNIPFNGISSDHTVIVEYERIKTEEPEPDPDINLYKVITRQTGGVYTSISPSAVVTEGSNYTVEWEPARMENKGGQIQRAQIEAPEPESYIIDSVTIDKGLVTERPLSEDEIETKAYPFEGIDRDYTVDIVFKKAVGEEEDAQKEKLLVNTELVGGPGVITPSAVVNQGDDFPVLWTAGEGYVVDTITVKANGVEMPGLVTSQDLVDLKNINDHYDVIVKLKKAPPAGEENPEETLYAITTSITGAAGACITPTLENIREGESHFVTWSVPEGYEVSSVIIDKVVIDGLLGATRVDFNEIVASHDVLVVLKLKNTGEDKEEYFEIKTSIESGGTITPTTRVEKGANHTVSWTADEGYIVARVEVNGVLRNDLIEAGKIDFTDIAKNHEVNVIFEKKGDIDPPPEDVLSVTTKITGGKGNITGGAIVKQGDDYRVEWTVEEGYEILDVIINGESRPDLLNKGQINLENINKNQQVEVVLGKAGPGTDPTPDPGPGTDPTPDPGPGTDPDPDPGDGSTGDINNGNSDNNTQNDQSPAEKLESEVKKSITAVMSEISPYTGIKDTLDHGAGQNQGAQRSRGSLMSLLFGNPDGVPGEGFFTKGNGNENEAGRMSLSLVDFFATALITALSVLALFRKRRSKIVMIVLAAVSIVLFFLTQPMVWVFTLWDRFSILFILLLLLGAVIMLASNKKERETEEESQENRA